MRQRWWCGLGVVLLLSACTRPNHGFEGGESEGAEEVDDRTTGGALTVGDGPTTGSGETTKATGETDGGSLDTTADTGDASSGMHDTGTVCVAELRARYDIVSEPPLVQLAGGCGAFPPQFVQVQGVKGDDNSLTGALCGEDCQCGPQTIMLTFDGPLPATPPGCIRLEVQLAAVGDDCVVEAYRLSNFNAELPIVVASNVEMPTFPQPIALELADEPTEACGGDCTPASGNYDLLTPTGTPIPPDGTPVPVQVTGGTYRVANEGSAVDLDCTPQVRWVAEQDF
jgi:hypothetical protein